LTGNVLSTHALAPFSWNVSNRSRSASTAASTTTYTSITTRVRLPDLTSKVARAAKEITATATTISPRRSASSATKSTGVVAGSGAPMSPRIAGSRVPRSRRSANTSPAIATSAASRTRSMRRRSLEARSAVRMVAQLNSSPMVVAVSRISANRTNVPLPRTVTRLCGKAYLARAVFNDATCSGYIWRSASICSAMITSASSGGTPSSQPSARIRARTCAGSNGGGSLPIDA
jgi:hypothetical protein